MPGIIAVTRCTRHCVGHDKGAIVSLFTDYGTKTG